MHLGCSATCMAEPMGQGLAASTVAQSEMYTTTTPLSAVEEICCKRLALMYCLYPGYKAPPQPKPSVTLAVLNNLESCNRFLTAWDLPALLLTIYMVQAILPDHLVKHFILHLS